MLLSQLIAGISGARVVGDPGCAINEVREDSRLVGPGDLFVAVPGVAVDGRRFIADAVARGAAAVLTDERDVTSLGIGTRAAVVHVDDARRALADVAANRYGTRGALTLTGVTGTNGKTTTTFLMEAMLAAAGRNVGLFGTVSYRYAGKHHDAPNTTPGALTFHRLLADMKAAGCTDAVMEVTSHALDQKRVHPCRFRVAALTNLTQDHLDYHGTMERYFQAKAILFREMLTPDGVAVLPAYRDEGLAMRREVRGETLMVSTRARDADVVVEKSRLDSAGTTLTLGTPSGRIEIHSLLVGDFNVENIVCAVGVGIAHGLSREVIAKGIGALRGVPGRLERVANDAGVLCVVDYAHTPDAIERAIAAVRPLTKGRLIVVFGCGGDRDSTKRPLMGEAAARLGDLAIVTSDNPRTENPEAIVAMVVEGVRRAGAEQRHAAELEMADDGYHVQVDRRRAIVAAIAAAAPGDTVLIAGKGHEDYQILGTTKIHFDDREEAAAAFAARGGR